jgi:16S rRNA processing protein RimM
MADHQTENARKLRLNSTEAEKLLWSKIRNKQISNLKFRHQRPIGSYIADFCCDDIKLIIEVDGGQHTPETDKNRTQFLQSQGYRILRFWNNDVLDNIEGVLTTIMQKNPHPTPLPQGEREQVKRILIGKIATAHGVRGDVKVQYFLDDVDLLFTPQGLYTSETKPDKIILTYKNNLNGKVLVCSVKGITDRNVAERLRGTSLYINESDMPELDENELYLRDIIGMGCATPEGKTLGSVISIQNFGASDLLEIQGTQGSFFIPFCEPYLVNVDKQTRTITLNEPEVM